jgi:RNA polymerase sigma-70 factor (ECF subfamily)
MIDNRDDTQRRRRWGELLCRAAEGDRAAFGELAVELKPYLLERLRICSCTRDLFRIPDDAEDAVHDALLAVWEKRASFDPHGHAIAWLWVIARNCAVDVLRRRSRQWALSLHDKDGRLLDVPAGAGEQPPALATAREQRQRLRGVVARALWSAEPRVRRAWHWRFRKRQPYEVIARRLGVPQGTVATWLHRFKQGLRQTAAITD